MTPDSGLRSSSSHVLANAPSYLHHRYPYPYMIMDVTDLDSNYGESTQMLLKKPQIKTCCHIKLRRGEWNLSAFQYIWVFISYFHMIIGSDLVSILLRTAAMQSCELYDIMRPQKTAGDNSDIVIVTKYITIDRLMFVNFRRTWHF